MSNTQIPSPGSNQQPSNTSDHNNDLQGSYVELHKPSSSFESRDAYLNHEL